MFIVESCYSVKVASQYVLAQVFPQASAIEMIADGPDTIVLMVSPTHCRNLVDLIGRLVAPVFGDTTVTRQMKFHGSSPT